MVPVSVFGTMSLTVQKPLFYVSAPMDGPLPTVVYEDALQRAQAACAPSAISKDPASCDVALQVLGGIVARDELAGTGIAAHVKAVNTSSLATLAAATPGVITPTVLAAAFAGLGAMPAGSLCGSGRQ